MTKITALGILLLAGAMLAAPQAKADGIFTAVLSGANEVPPTGSTAFGNITVTLTGDSLGVVESFAGLTGGNAAAAHIHCCAGPGVNAGVALPLTSFPSATSGTYSQTFDLTQSSVYTAGFETANGGTAAGAESALIAGLFGGLAYANIHDASFPGGEIRGQLNTQTTPEPATLMLLGIGLTALVTRKNRRTA